MNYGRAACILSLLFASCTVHLHIHEAPSPVSAAQALPASSETNAFAMRSVRGVVRDGKGVAVVARVALVGALGGGSRTTTSGSDGQFAMSHGFSSKFALTASTEDGGVAVSDSPTENREVELVLKPGATIMIQLEGLEKARCAVFAGGLRIEDFTLRAGPPARVVVPGGEIRVRIYEGDHVFEDRQFAAQVGRTEEIRMKPAS